MSSHPQEFGVISDDYRILSRIQEIADDFGYTFKHWKTAAEFEADASSDFRIIIGAVTDPKNKVNSVALSEMIRKKAPASFIICSVAGTVAKETAQFAKKAGADLILLEEEVLRTSKLDYACSEIIRASFLAIKVTDILAGKPLEFDIYHLLPQRQKFLKFLFQGDILSPEKAKKIEQVGEIYIRRNQASEFSEYIKRYEDGSSEHLAKKCRAVFLALYASFSSLAFLLSDQSENSSFKEGEDLMKRSRILAGELLKTLAAYGNPFEVVNNSTIGEFGSIERTPAIAAYVGYFALKLGWQNIDELMMGALLGNVGLLLLPSSITKKVRLKQTAEFLPEELQLYEKYPLSSLDLALGRKLPVDQYLRKSILSVVDPSTLICFCSELDKRTLVMLGKPRVNPALALENLVKETVKRLGRMDPNSEAYSFGADLRKAFLS
jgi:hypothetical protein